MMWFDQADWRGEPVVEVDDNSMLRWKPRR
jgi:hypothetical protein